MGFRRAGRTALQQQGAGGSSSAPLGIARRLLSTPTVLVLPRERTLGLQRDKSCLTMRRRRSFHPLEHAAEPAGPFPALEVRCQGSVADCSHTAATPRDLQGPRGYQCSQFQPVPHWEHPSCSPFASEQALLCPRALQRHATVPAAREDAEGGDEESHPLLHPSPSSSPGEGVQLLSSSFGSILPLPNLLRVSPCSPPTTLCPPWPCRSWPWPGWDAALGSRWWPVVGRLRLPPGRMDSFSPKPWHQNKRLLLGSQALQCLPSALTRSSTSKYTLEPDFLAPIFICLWIS